ncbi:hypothetical protein Gpo141_00004294 [Globisporangium polare]
MDHAFGYGAEQNCGSSNSRLVLRLSARSHRLLWCFILLYQLANGLLLASMAAMYGSVEQRGTILWFLRYNFLFSRAQRFLTSVHRYASAGYALFAVLFVFGALSMIWHSVRQERLCYSSTHRPSSSPAPQQQDQRHLIQPQSSPPTARRTLVAWYKQLVKLHQSFGLRGRHFAIGFFAREVVESALQTTQAFQSSRSLSNVFVNQSYGALIFLNCLACVVLPQVYKRTNIAKGRLVCVLLDLLLDFAWGTVIPLVVFWPYLQLFLAYQQDAYVAVPPENVQKEVEFILVMSTSDFILSAFPFVSSAANLHAIKQFVKHDDDELKLRMKPGANGDVGDINADGIEDSFAVMAANNTTESGGRVSNKPLTRGRWVFISLQALFLIHGMLILTISIASQWRSTGSHATEAYECLHRMHPWLSTKEACVGRVISCAAAGIDGASEDIEAALSLFDETTLSNLVVSECPSLQVPPEIHRFRHLSVFTIENSHVLEWTEDAALTDEFFDSLQTIRVTNVTFASAPDGILNDPLPRASEWVVMRDVDMGGYLDTVGDNWQHLKFFYCDLCNISSFPTVVESMTGLVELSLSYNGIDTIEDSNIEPLTSLENLWLDGLPLTDFPEVLWKKSSQMGDFSFQNTQISEIPAFVDRVADENLQMYAFGTPLCENETKATRTRFLSCVEQEY